MEKWSCMYRINLAMHTYTSLHLISIMMTKNVFFKMHLFLRPACRFPAVYTSADFVTPQAQGKEHITDETNPSFICDSDAL